MRYIALTFAAVLVASCAPSVQRLGEARFEPTESGAQFRMADGVSLPYRVWPADGPAKAIIVAVHGFNDYSNAFESAGAYWSDIGITTYAYDQRGFGESPQPGVWTDRETLGSDLASALKLTRSKHQDLPVFVLGASMGAAVVIDTFNGSEPQMESPEGIVLVSPAVWHGGFMGPFYRSLLWISAHTFPGSTATGSSFDRQASDNIEMLRAFSRDPLVIKETRVDAVYGLIGLMRQAYMSADRLPAPLLALYGERDEIVPLKSLRELQSRLPEHRNIWYPDGYHMLLRDLQAEKVWQDIANWIDVTLSKD